MEHWKPVPGYKGLYEVSNKGRIRRVVEQPQNRFKKGYVLKPDTVRGGYLRVTLTKRKKTKRHMAHRLMLTAFVGPPPEGHEANHIDGRKKNNKLENLEWVTRSENHLHACRVLGKRQGPKNGRAKLTTAQAIEIKKRLKAGDSLLCLARKFNISEAAIWQIRRGKNWRHI